MERKIGTRAMGIRTPIIKEGDDLPSIVVNSILEASKTEGFSIKDQDIIGITEAVVAISNGDYVTVDDIATDIKEKFPNGELAVVFPILSRNRFSLILKGIARGTRKIYMLLSYPADEVGNHLFSAEDLYFHKINPWSDVLTEKRYMELFGDKKHIFTSVNYVQFYKELIEKENCQVEFIFANNPREILNYTKNVLVSSIHTRNEVKKALEENGAVIVYGLDDILSRPSNYHRHNSEYGLLGSNKSTEERLKLFPTNGVEVVNQVQQKMKELTGKDVEVLIYGDGAFKDPVGKIWELADPVVSPAYTKGLEGTPNEIKLKYISDNKYANLRGEKLNEAMKKEIMNKKNDLKGKMESQGTTPRRLTDLIGSLCDLVSGSGDKGTPVILIQGYFDNYADE